MNTEKRFKKLIIISSPSGAGKTTICKYLLKKIKKVELSISYTTRYKRINEIHGKDYYFINTERFFTLIKKMIRELNRIKNKIRMIKKYSDYKNKKKIKQNLNQAKI